MKNYIKNFPVEEVKKPHSVYAKEAFKMLLIVVFPEKTV